MGKAQEEYNKYLTDRVTKIDQLNKDTSKAKEDAENVRIDAYVALDKAYSDALVAIENEGIKLQKLALQEFEEEMKADAIKLEQKINKASV